MKHGEVRILTGDCRSSLAGLAAGSVQCVVTSPPYWGLRAYIDDADEIGREPTLEGHLESLVGVFREVRRVLRDDGVVWLNYGDAYGSSNGKSRGDGRFYDGGEPRGVENRDASARSGDLMLLPYRVAEAMRADGWLVRDAVIWAKAVSFCPSYSGSCMPESVQGTRWERCRVKVASARGGANPKEEATRGTLGRNASLNDWQDPEALAQWSDCPGCDKCRATGGYVLRRGSWRTTRSYEVVFLMAKGPGYFADGEAVREKHRWEHVGSKRCPSKNGGSIDAPVEGMGNTTGSFRGFAAGGRNLRSVWTINPQPYSESHFATYPERLIEPMIKVGTSEKGCCPECGAPWARVVETETHQCDDVPDGSRNVDDSRGDRTRRLDGKNGHPSTSRTLGWRSTCECIRECDPRNPGEWKTTPEHGFHPTPCTVLDPFGGSGTTALVANRLGRDAIICELNPEYAKLAKDRIGKGLRPTTYRDETKETDAPLFTHGSEGGGG